MAEQWTDENPGSVDLGVLQSAITDLDTASTAYADAKKAAKSITATLKTWSGASADAWKATAADVAGELEAHRQRLLDARAAISAYRSTCSDISNRASVYRATVHDAMRVLSSDAPRASGDDYEEWQREHYVWQLKQRQAQDDLSYAQTMLRSLGAERGDADRTLVAALSQALPPNWSHTRAMLAASGISSPSDLTRDKIINAMVDLARAGALASSRDGLQLLLDMYQDNEAVMSQFFSELGGDDTLRLIDEIGDLLPGASVAAAAALLLLANRLRAGLSLGSRNWTIEQSRAFASQMVSDATLASSEIDGNAAIAYLFSASDGDTMGENLVMQTAIAIDKRERVEGQFLSNLAVDSRLFGGGTALMFAEHPELAERMPGGPDNGYERFIPSDDYAFFYVDAAGEVFETLGLYPESAFEFIGSDSAAADRIRYWYGGQPGEASGIAHNWVADGFEGVASLWLGASKVEGGPVAGVYDPAIGQQEALLTGLVIEALAGKDGFGTGNPKFLSENLTDTAAILFGSAITLHLDGIAQALQGPEDGLIGTNGGRLLAFTDPITGDTQQIANLSSDAFANLLGQVGGNPAGGMTVKAGVELISQAIFASAGNDPAALPGAVERVVTLHGIADGAGVGATLGAAERSDAELRATIDRVTGGVESLLGFVPIPGGSLVGGTVGVASGLGIEAWADNWYAADESYPTVADRAATLERLGQAALPSRLAATIYAQCGDALGLAPPPPWQAGSAAYETWVINTLDGLAENYGVNSGHIIDGYEQAFSAGSAEVRG